MESQIQKSSDYASILLFEAAARDTNIVIYFDQRGTQKKIISQIPGKYQQDGKDYIRMRTGQQINVGDIFSVDGDLAPQYDQDYFKCDCV
ncbi:MAG: hypothetical protein RIF33_13225 [Cyclobacteriaceae bacterium]